MALALRMNIPPSESQVHRLEKTQYANGLRQYNDIENAEIKRQLLDRLQSLRHISTYFHQFGSSDQQSGFSAPNCGINDRI